MIKPTTNETSVFKDFLFVLLLTPERCKGIDDDTKDEIEDDDDHHKEEQQIVDHSKKELRLL